MVVGKSTTPWKMQDVEAQNDALEDDFPDFNWVIFRFQAVNLPGCMSLWGRVFCSRLTKNTGVIKWNLLESNFEGGQTNGTIRLRSFW